MRLLLFLLAVSPPAWAAAVLLRPPFPRIFGRQACLPGCLCACWGAGAAGLAVLVPGATAWTAAAGAALGAFMARGRIAAWFASRPLPPGSLSFAAGVSMLASRNAYLQGFAKRGPIFTTTQFGAPVICVGGMERICRLMQCHAAHLGPSSQAFTRSLRGNFLRYMEGEAHAKYGGLFRRAMAGDPTEATVQRLRSSCRGMLDALAADGSSRPDPALRRFTRESLELILFGLTGNNDRSQEFKELADAFYPVSIGRALGRSDLRLLDAMVRFLAGLVRRPGTDAGEPPVIARLHALDASMPDRVCLENLVLMHKITTNDVSSLLRWLLFYWGTQPEIVRRIRTLHGTERDGALEAFLSETLRLSQSEYLYRRVARGFTFEGFHFPRGWMVRMCIWESHRTTDALPAPADFRLRLDPGDYARGHFSPFGMGRHACSGADINRAICLALLGELAGGFDAVIEQAEPFTRRMRHWCHWQPNHSMKVRLRTA